MLAGSREGSRDEGAQDRQADTGPAAQGAEMLHARRSSAEPQLPWLPWHGSPASCGG